MIRARARQHMNQLCDGKAEILNRLIKDPVTEVAGSFLALGESCREPLFDEGGNDLAVRPTHDSDISE